MAVIPPTMKVLALSLPNVTAAWRRSPTGAAIWRAILVLPPVSLRKTRLAGSMNGCVTFHSVRHAAKSGRFCSAAFTREVSGEA